MITPGKRIVAFGGGHGLAASLRALRQLRTGLGLDITAVVTVADDGGSSGRLRADRGGLPPGDLRQALAALADPADPVGTQTAELWQYRFDGNDPLAGHAVGNLLLHGLMEMIDDPVVALDRAASMVRAVGRVLPMSPAPVGIEADVRGLGLVHGQHSVAVARGVVEEVRLTPTHPPACAEALAAIRDADWLIFGPGSWYTSVIPHLLVPDLAAAIAASPARRVVCLNLALERETAGMSLPDHLRALARYLPGLRVDVVLADGKVAVDPIGLETAAQSLGARVVLAPVAVADGGPRHDPVALALALQAVLTAPNEPHNPEQTREVTTRWR